MSQAPVRNAPMTDSDGRAFVFMRPAGCTTVGMRLSADDDPACDPPSTAFEFCPSATVVTVIVISLCRDWESKGQRNGQTGVERLGVKETERRMDGETVVIAVVIIVFRQIILLGSVSHRLMQVLEVRATSKCQHGTKFIKR